LRQNRAWFDLVHAHSFGHSTALLASLGERGEFLFTPHYHGVGHTPLARFTHLGYDPLAKQIFKTASDIICVSEAEAVNLTRDYPICTNRTVVIPNGIDIESISSAAPFDCLEPVVLAIGRLEHYKQFDRIITAMSSVSIPAKLVIIGDGPARESLTRSVESLGLANRVQFLGRVATSELRRWQKTAHLVISMSRFEAFGLVLAEGAVAGCRVVASDTPAHREVAEQYGGPFEFVPIDIDAVELANVISRSLGLPRVCADPGKLISWSEMASRVLARYELALSDRETAGQQLGC
jgi:glycosyltransferase involved in cell wall biosynthesis